MAAEGRATGSRHTRRRRKGKVRPGAGGRDGVAGGRSADLRPRMQGEHVTAGFERRAARAALALWRHERARERQLWRREGRGARDGTRRAFLFFCFFFFALSASSSSSLAQCPHPIPKSRRSLERHREPVTLLPTQHTDFRTPVLCVSSASTPQPTDT